MELETPDIVVSVKQSVTEGNKESTAKLLVEMEAELRMSKPLVKWLIHPANLTELQNSIIETYGIPRKAMMVRNRSHSQGVNAINFAKAMRIAVERSMRE